MRISSHLTPSLALGLSLLISSCASREDTSTDESEPAGQPTLGEPSPDPLGGQTGAEIGLAPCRVAVPLEVSDSEDSPGGFSVEDVLERLAAVHPGSFEWADGTASPNAVSPSSLELVRAVGAAQWLEFSAEPLAPTTEGPGIDCAARSALSIPVEVVLLSEDGQLAESWEFVLQATALDQAEAVRPIPVTGWSGNFEPTSLLEGDEDSLDLVATLGVQPDTVSLVLEGGASTANPSPDSLVQVRRVPLGRFVAPLTR